MKREDVLKWAAVALGAYWLIQKFQDQQAPPPAGALPPGYQPQPQLPPASGEAPGQAVAEMTPDQSTLILITQAAVDPIVAGQLGSSVKMNSDQWNHYRLQGGGDVSRVDLFPPGDRNYQMTAIEYHEARAVNLQGMAGVGGYIS